VGCRRADRPDRRRPGVAAGLGARRPVRRARAILHWTDPTKAWAKALVQGAGIPTARAEVVENATAGLEAARRMGFPVVIKADGLAAGKGVHIAQDEGAARDALKRLMLDREVGDAADRVLVEEHLVGEEVSVLAFTDGRDVAIMPFARDYKRVGDGDSGPNTGGMGAYAPVPFADAALVRQVREKILMPTIATMRAEGHPYKGILYAGLMLTRDGPKVLEFNCRFGDPEAQAILPLLESDLAMIFRAIVSEELARTTIEWNDDYTCVVVAASGGYPGEFRTGIPIRGMDSAEGVIVFHGGTRRDRSGRHIITTGGRVFSAVGRGETLEAAREAAYQGIERIGFEGIQYRRDIAANVGTVPGVVGARPRAISSSRATADGSPTATTATIVPSPLLRLGKEGDLSAVPVGAVHAGSGRSAADLGSGTARIGLVGAGERDLPLIEAAASVCEDCDVPSDAVTVEPYRSPEVLRDWLQSAERAGVRALVGVGAVAPHLPSMLAAMTTLPVIGVGARDDDSSAWEALRGLLALSGAVPVAMAGMGDQGARNAAMLAIAILALSDPELASRYAALRAAQQE
jgi:phosphoribosylamine---glycine ligase